MPNTPPALRHRAREKSTLCWALPIGLSSEGLPIAMQVIGRQRDDLGVLQAMAAMEDLIGFDELAQGF